MEQSLCHQKFGDPGGAELSARKAAIFTKQAPVRCHAESAFICGLHTVIPKGLLRLPRTEIKSGLRFERAWSQGDDLACQWQKTRFNRPMSTTMGILLNRVRSSAPSCVSDFGGFQVRILPLKPDTGLVRGWASTPPIAR
jgi:hypothetical protein